ncbi:hypothetical protein HZU40_00655 (plasmid) [Mycolicibacterium fluoranthenivorans]|uniref:Uncharacterized protein n=1 Tax=Mycolicibacterium fluoranthenivorans TaxID=258505 RepID=A0A7G8P6S7_9MYCO|nr:hypothetical protein HZU40_00655 [Mycolicibacterium fluoranthenivorans]
MGTEQFADPESGTDWHDTEGYGSERQTPPPPRIDATVRAPLDYAYTAIDIMAALPRSQAVDAAALPADLQRKARAHGDDLDNIVESEQLTTRHRRDLIWTEIARVGRFVEPTAKYGAPAAASIAVVLMVGHWWRHTGTSAVEILVASNPFGYLAIALGAAALLVRFARRRAATAPHWVYTDDELATLEAASIDWPAVPEELDRYANGEALRREWHNRWMSRIHPGGAALVWREPHLVAVATLLGRDIRSSPAWNSELLDIHRVRIDLERTLDDIYIRAHRIWRARANLVPPPNKDPADVVARRNAEITDAAGDAWNTLVALVGQLQDYRKSLTPVDVIFAEIRALHQSSLRITDDAVRQLHVDAAGNSLHTGAVGAATVELADLNANLAARLSTLRQSLTATTNSLVLRAP